MHVLYVLFVYVFRKVQRMRWTETNAVRSATCSSHLPLWLSRTTRAKHTLREFAWYWGRRQVCLHPQVKDTQLQAFLFCFLDTTS